MPGSAISGREISPGPDQGERAARSVRRPAWDFFDACVTGKGWEVCGRYCHDGAALSAQADGLAGVNTAEGYTEWMKGLLTPVPDGHCELKSFAVDEERHAGAATAVLHGTHTVDAGNGAPTGRTVAADYVHLMAFDGDRIRRMTRI